MKYRVKYRFPGQRYGYHYTEWYDTDQEAATWADEAGFHGLVVIHIEAETGEIV